MEPKPLTKDEREGIAIICREASEAWTVAAIEKALSAEAFWREAVKSAIPMEFEGVLGCQFCAHGTVYSVKEEFPIQHSLYCPWKLAQEAE